MTFNVVAAVAISILAPKESNLAQKGLVLSPELSVHDTVNEWVDSATQIGQERVRQVNLSWYRVFSARGVHVIHDSQAELLLKFSSLFLPPHSRGVD